MKKKEESSPEQKKLIRLNYDDLNGRYEQKTAVFRAECVFATECVGGQPPDEEGIKNFVIHHLGITDETEIENAVKRIKSEELEDVTPVEGEISEAKIYGMRSLRRDNGQVWLGDWMIKACAKVALSRLGIFSQKRGSKGDVAEVGRVRGWKYSFDKDKPWQVIVRNSTDTSQCHTYFKDFMGRVSGVNGPVSIIHKSECIAPGSRFAFEFRFLPTKLSQDDIKDVLAFMMTVGLGSVRSMERGKFRIENAEIEI